MQKKRGLIAATLPFAAVWLLANGCASSQIINTAASSQEAQREGKLISPLAVTPCEFALNGVSYKIHEAWLEHVNSMVFYPWLHVEFVEGTYLCFTLEKGANSLTNSMSFGSRYRHSWRIKDCEPLSQRKLANTEDYVFYQRVKNPQSESWQGMFGGPYGNGVRVTFTRTQKTND